MHTRSEGILSNVRSTALVLTKWRIALIFGMTLASILAGCRSRLSLSEALSRQQAEDGIPGLVAVATRSDSIVESSAAGTRRIGQQSPVTVNERFHLGSNGKAMRSS
jgi:CubicO group peptidase (beta-lactamase class C family)